MKSARGTAAILFTALADARVNIKMIDQGSSELNIIIGVAEEMCIRDSALGVPENEEIHHKSLTKTIERAQKKIEGNNFGIRKNLMEYDKVNNDQREIIYAERARVLNGENMRDAIIKMMNEVIESQVDMFVGDDQETKDWDVAGLSQSLFEIIPVKLEIPKSEIEQMCIRDRLIIFP